MTKEEIRAYLAGIGRKGGEATGKSKVRGDAAYYKKIARKAVKARKAKKAMGKKMADIVPDGKKGW